MKIKNVPIKCPRCKQWSATVENTSDGYWQAECENRDCNNSWVSAAHKRISDHVDAIRARQIKSALPLI